jgi:hypothetical protein
MKSFCVFLILAMAPELLAQGTVVRPPEVEAERLRIEADERARREAEQRDWETKIFRLQHVDAGIMRTALSMFRASIASEANLGVLSIRAPKEIMPAIADAIKMLDVPRVAPPARIADLTIYLVEASNSPSATPSEPMPAALRPVVDQLKSVLTYKEYKVATTIFARGSDGRDTQNDGFLNLGGQELSKYGFRARFNIETSEQGKQRLLRLQNMEFWIQVLVPGSAGWQNIRIATNVDIPLGQQVVVGKTTLADRAFILVMNSKFVD